MDIHTTTKCQRAPNLELKELSVGYREGHAIKIVAKNLSATLNSGSFICLVGRNGVGKSTLLRTLAGFLPPLAGDILLDGNSLSLMSRQTLSETIGVVLTDHIDMPNMTLSDIVGMGRSPYTNFWGTLQEEDYRIVADAMRDVGLTALADAPISRVSDGERQKAMIAKALAQQTDIIILDEPTAFLDYPSKIAIMSLLRSLAHERRKIVFLSTHDLDVAYRLADDIWIMDEHGLTVQASPEQLLALSFHPV